MNKEELERIRNITYLDEFSHALLDEVDWLRKKMNEVFRKSVWQWQGAAGYRCAYCGTGERQEHLADCLYLEVKTHLDE